MDNINNNSGDIIHSELDIRYSQLVQDINEAIQQIKNALFYNINMTFVKTILAIKLNYIS